MKSKGKKTASYETITTKQYETFQRAFTYFNEKLFDGSLPEVLVTLQRRGSTYGYFSPQRFAGRTNKAMAADEIALNPDHFLGRTDEQICSTLVHEQVHQLQYVQATAPRRGYHNKEFAAMMKKVGLHPSSTGEPGGRETGGRMHHYVIEGGPFERAYAELAKTGFKLDWQSKPPERKQRQSKKKFTCPNCGQNAWAKPDAQLICGFCKTVPMTASQGSEEVAHAA